MWIAHRVTLGASALLGALLFTGSMAPNTTTATPPLTVVGFGLAPLPAGSSSPPQLNLTLQVSDAAATAALASLEQDVATVRTALAKAGVPDTAITAQPPQLNYVPTTSSTTCQRLEKLKGVPIACPSPGFQASESVQVQFSSLTQLATTITATQISQSPGVQNVWIDSGNQIPGKPSDAALTAAYRQALADAQHTATLLAQAQGIRLGAVTAIRQGAGGSASCGGPGCGPLPPPGVTPPAIGPNQELVAVTVTYATEPASTP
ncbi:MAG: SIMPL domain-containing protein [Firmicutes bacterium]|nr:SIMPL domain-containing protein [Alicyclobacillaceae bacterium]MCL6497744.1 SIMPL domain-containing protein [Bacillota bacterium]